MTLAPERRRRVPQWAALPMLGPAFVAAVAYVDPGNFATNIAAGASHGYLLVWVIIVSSGMAMLVQYLSAKVGIATGQTLPELCRAAFPRRTNIALWLQGEAVAMATDLAEVLGGALALSLLFDLPLMLGGLVTGAAAFATLALTNRGHRPFERVIVGLLAVVTAGFLLSLVTADVSWEGAARGLLPRFDGAETVLLATGILGATVMPHVIYLHSALTAQRAATATTQERARLLTLQRVDIPAALLLAGAVNLSMLLLAAAALSGRADAAATIEGAHAAIGVSLGDLAALGFAMALLASGLAASAVGTYSGQVIMQGFVGLRVPLALRRLVTLAPAVIILAIGVDVTQALVWSQVVLSFGIPCALIPLVLLTRDADRMGQFVNERRTTVVAALAAGVVVTLNVFLLAQLML